jgi:hypothetical protein
MEARHFETPQALADYQADREVQEALRVSMMTGEERYLWLEENWGKLQDQASALYADIPRPVAAARCYASFDEKNRFDEEREIQFALQVYLRSA